MHPTAAWNVAIRVCSAGDAVQDPNTRRTLERAERADEADVERFGHGDSPQEELATDEHR